MAKESKDGKFQFVFVNIEGDQETLQEALRQVGTVLHQGIRPAVPTRTLIAVPVNKGLGNGSTTLSDGSQSEMYEVQPEEAPSEATPVSVSATTPKPKREKKAAKVPELLKGFDPNDAEVSMTDFFSQHDTSSQFNKYLSIAAWFKRYKNVEEITVSHIYTCYQLMKWQAPDNMSQPFTDMKRLRSYFDKGTQGGWSITIVGMNEVDRVRVASAAA